MLGEPVGDARLDVPQGRRIERHQVLGGVDQLAVQRPVVVAADLATGGHRRVRRDAPPRQSGAVQHVLVTAPDDDHRMVRRNGVEVAPQRQALLGELRLVPVGVGDHDSAGCGLAHRRRDGRQHLGQRARAGQVHPRPAAARVEVVVGQPRHDRAPAEVDHARRSRLVRTHLGIRPHRQDPAVGDGDRPRPRLRVIHGDDVAVDENRVGGPRRLGPRREADGRQTARQAPEQGRHAHRSTPRYPPPVGLELAPPVGRVPRNDHDVALGDASRHAPLDTRAPDVGDQKHCWNDSAHVGFSFPASDFRHRNVPSERLHRARPGERPTRIRRRLDAILANSGHDSTCALFAEYESVLARPELFLRSSISDTERDALLAALISRCTWVRVYYLWRPNLPDEADNHLVELAVAGNAEAIVTHNTRDFETNRLALPGVAHRDARSADCRALSHVHTDHPSPRRHARTDEGSRATTRHERQ